VSNLIVATPEDARTNSRIGISVPAPGSLEEAEEVVPEDMPVAVLVDRLFCNMPYHNAIKLVAVVPVSQTRKH